MGLNTEIFIARRMLKGGFEKKISKPIVNLASIGIVLGVMVMILSVSIASGFQTEIKNKVLGFGGHIQITEQFGNESQESPRMLVDQYWLNDLKQDPIIEHIQQIAYKPGIIQSKNSFDTSSSGKSIREITGLVFKGISMDYDYEFILSNLLKGEIPKYGNESYSNDSILLSLFTANQLKVDTGDKVSCFFVSEGGPKQKNLVVGGIYETGLEDFDKQFAFADLAMIRDVNKWGIETFISIEEQCTNGYIILRAESFGGNGNYYYSWNGSSFSEANRIPLCFEGDSLIVQVVSSDIVTSGYFDEPDLFSVADTAWLTIIKLDDTNLCSCSSSDELLNLNFVDNQNTTFSANGVSYKSILKTSGGSSKYYCGGYEVLITDLDKIDEGKKTVNYYTDNLLNVQSIKDRNEDIFNWLNMLDLNVVIIIGLMILVAIINMTSALLVIILERTRMIGILKSLGSRNWSIRKIFLINGSYIILRGVVIGSILAILIIILQNTFGFLKLSQSNYYVSEVPMHFVWLKILLIDVGAFLFCLAALILPSYLITRISPVNAIKFE
ncbi:MAG: ABC transporter permease [Flavobacteriales bacterium]|nr:ABC transporter permease [Flavobacteriales bacterium]